MGGACVRCGYDDDIRALQIDHVNGDGRLKTRKINTNTPRYYAEVLANPDQFQLLCANCNVIKRMANGEHRDKATYTRRVPTEDRPRSPGRHTPEANARRSATQRKRWEDPELRAEKAEVTRAANAALTEEQRAEKSRKIREAKLGTKKGPDGKFHRPD